jgi:hypothetical protein
MAYSAEINRNSPACFLFLVDLSSSMLEAFGAQPEKSKAEGVADAINRLLSNLVIKCTKSEGVRDYFNVGVISYGGRVQPALGGALEGLYLVPVSKIAEHPLRLEKRQRRIPDGAGGFLETSIKFPVWFDPKAVGRTPMCGALTTAQTVLKKFIEQYPRGFPPIVVNITDGMATDGDPVQRGGSARRLCQGAVPHVQHVAAADAGGGQGGGLRGAAGQPGLCLQRRPGLGDPLPGHRHPRRPTTRGGREVTWPPAARCAAR